MNGNSDTHWWAAALSLILGLILIGCSSDSGTVTSEAEAAPSEVTVTTAAPPTTEAETATTSVEATEASTTTEVATAESADLAVLTSFLDALDAQDYDTLLGSLHPDYAATIAPGSDSTWSTFWVFQALFDYDALEEPDCQVGAAAITCNQVVNDRLARLLDYDFTTTIAATFEGGKIRTAALSSSDEDFFIPLLIWSSTQPETRCTSEIQGPYEGMTEEEVAAARAKVLTDFDPDEPVVASTIECVDYMVDNVEAFAALPDSPPLPTR